MRCKEPNPAGAAPGPAADRHRLEGIRPRLEARARILAALRDWFARRGFLEVETPQRVRAPAPERHIDAVRSGDRFLLASPELQMKRLLAAGYGRIFQICRCFRDGERGERHLPEFTMLEWYRAGAGIEDLMEDCEGLLAAAADGARWAGTPAGPDGSPVDLAPPFRRLAVADAFERFAGWRPGADPDPERFDLDLVGKIEPALPGDRPVFLVGYPASLASLSRLDPADPDQCLRFELYAGGLELANGFDELTDPAEQRRRFAADEAWRRAAGKPPYPADERFLAALEAGMPSCAGIALGVDRLVMLLTGARTIDDVVAFPEETD